MILLILSVGCVIGGSTPAANVATSLPSDTPTETTTSSPTSSPTMTPTPTYTQTPSVTATLTQTPSPTETATPMPTETATPTPSPTATVQPTYAILRGKVIPDQVMCFYGPSKAYLFKYALIGGSNLEIIGILPDTQYIQVRAIGGSNPCWMNLEWMEVRGDINALQPIDPLTLDLPMSPYYAPLKGVQVSREGEKVTISWSPLILRAGDDSEQEPYLVEAWVCQGGKRIFIPLGLYQNTVTVTDEAGCEQPSFARVYGVEKHGYTRPVEVLLTAGE